MSIRDKLNADMKTAMLQKDKESLSVIRMLISEIKYAQAKVNLQTELPESENLKVVSSYQKRLVKALEEFPPGEDRKKLEAEIKIVERYLPQRAGQQEMSQIIKDIWNEKGQLNFGDTMKEAMGKLEGRVDGKALSELIKALQAGS